MADYVVRMTGQDNLSGTIKQVKSELNDLGKTTSKLDQIDAKFNKITQSAVGVKKEMRDLTALGSQLKFDGDYNAAQLLKIAEAAGEAKDSMDDFNAMKRYFADDNRHLNTAIQGMQGLAAAGSVTAGVLGMVGVEQDKVNQAILWCQSALSVLNGLNTIANVLNKDSYVSIAAKVLGLQAEAAAETEVTAATNAATGAQIKNNLAVLANPYVAAAVAIAALVGGIIYWVSTMDDATEEQEQLNGAVDAFTEAADSQTGTLTKQITAFESLKKVYDESGGRADILTKKILNNKEAQNAARLSLKTLDDVHRVFRDHSNNYIEAATARANAFVVEAAQSEYLRASLTELSKVYNKLMKGEEVDWVDIMKPLEKVVGKDKARQIIEEAGGKQAWDYFFSNLEVDPNKVAEFMIKVNSAFEKAFFETGPGKILADFQAKMMEQAQEAAAPISDLLEKGNEELKTTGGKGGDPKKVVKATKKEVVGLINEMEELIRKDEEAVKSATSVEALKKAQETLKKDKEAYQQFKYAMGIEVDPKIKDQEKAAETFAKNLEKLGKKGVDLFEKDQHKFDITSSYERATGANKYNPKELSGIKARMDANDKMIESLRDLEQQYKDLGITSGKELDEITQKILELLAANDALGASARQLIKDQKDKEKADEEEKKRTEEKQKLYEDLMSTAQSLGSGLQSLGQEEAAAAIQIATTTAQAVQQIIPQVMALIGVKQGEALASGTASAAAMPFPANIAAIAAIVAQLMAVFATIASVAGKFAGGGVVGGGSSYGDMVMARVNAGEMILNRRQQANLFRAIESGDIGAGQTVLVPEFKIKGSDLYGTLRNFSKSVGKTGKITGIR